MKKAASKFITWSLSVFAFVFAAQADTLINNFSTSRNYVLNGILGENNWDGIHLNFGSVPFGNNDGQLATTVTADETTFAGYLNLRTSGTDWSAANDDGFFIYKVVSGDFDVSVQSAPFTLSGGTAYDNRANHFAGLLVRAYATNNSDAPFSTTVTAPSENWAGLFRMNQFGAAGEIRTATNGANQERTYTSFGGVDSTNLTHWLRITRTNNTLHFFVKTNLADAFTLITSGLPASGDYIRNDWAGIPLQVGIEASSFGTAQRDAVFTDFELSGTNVTFPAVLPPAPSNLITTATNITGQLTFSWTVGDPGDRSLVILKQGNRIQQNPINGITYVSSPVFGNTNTIIGGSTYVVYNGTGNSVTVSNLGANNITYDVAVYEYTNSSSPIYNTLAPATNRFAGPGIITGAFLRVAQNDIPVQGAVAVRLIASFSTGETSDQSPASTWGSSDTTVATVDAAGTVTAVTNGVTTITGTFGAFVLNTNITVHTPVFVDGFTSTNNYVANGLVGSMYDGMFLNFGDFPGQFADATGPGKTTVLDSQVTSTNGLSISANQTDWQGIRDDGMFLFKVVPGSRNTISGDFEASMEINTMNTLAANKVGLMARLYDPLTHGPAPGGNENHVNYYKVQNGLTQISAAIAAVNTTFVATGSTAGNRFLLLQRVNSTNFYFFERAATNAPWTFVTSIVLAAAANNAPMEVGIAQETRSGVTGTAIVRGFMLDAAGVVGNPPPPASNFGMTLNGNLSMTLNWVAADGLGNPVQSIVVMKSGAPVSAQPSLGQPLTASSVFGTPASGLGSGNYVVFVSAAAPASTNNTVTVTGLTPGVVYYAAVYTFTGSGANKVFNVSGVSGTLTDGFQIGLSSSLDGGIPRGGVAQLFVNAIYTGGFPVDKSTLANVSSSNTNIVKVLAGFLTGVTNGTANITNSFGGFTNVTPVTVRNPVFTDSFTNSNDYLVNGVVGTGWDDLYNPRDGVNPIPSSAYVPLALSGATVADANVSSNGTLTITSAGDGWENAAAGGFFLFKYIPGDFQASVHINSFDVAGFNQPGILARAYGASNGVAGLPLGRVLTNATGVLDAGEYWVDFTRFDEFNIGTYGRRNIDSVVSQNTQTGQGDNNFWLLIIRTQGTNFNFFQRLNPTDPWKRTPGALSYKQSEFAGRPMQVGLMAGAFTGTSGTQLTVRFENYMLDYTTGSILKITQSGGNVIVNWPPIPSAILQSTTNLLSAVWTTVPGAPVLDTNGYSLTVPALNTQFFRLKQ